MSKKYDVAVVIGRFQPLHNSHVELINRAAELATTVVVVIGSAYQPRTLKNPWTAKERMKMISHAVDTDAAEYKCMFNIDTIYDDAAWCTRIKDAVYAEGTEDDSIVLVGYHKDSSSFYLDMFPDWGYVEVNHIQPMDATDIRDIYFNGNKQCLDALKSVVPSSTFEVLANMMNTSTYKELVAERAFLEEHKKQYFGLPYAPVFVTADALVMHKEHVLMVKRKHIPGKGLWALPGGYVNARTDGSVQAAAIRELQEETNIDVSEATLVKCIDSQRTFDAMGRSARGLSLIHI